MAGAFVMVVFHRVISSHVSCFEYKAAALFFPVKRIERLLFVADRRPMLRVAFSGYVLHRLTSFPFTCSHTTVCKFVDNDSFIKTDRICAIECPGTVPFGQAASNLANVLRYLCLLSMNMTNEGCACQAGNG